MSWAQAFCLQEGTKAYHLVTQRPVLLRCTPFCAVSGCRGHLSSTSGDLPTEESSPLDKKPSPERNVR